MSLQPEIGRDYTHVTRVGGARRPRMPELRLRNRLNGIRSIGLALNALTIAVYRPRRLHVSGEMIQAIVESPLPSRRDYVTRTLARA